MNLFLEQFFKDYCKGSYYSKHYNQYLIYSQIKKSLAESHLVF